MVRLSACAFRKLEQGDLAVILEWRNAPKVRAAMFTTHVISPEEHQRWFERISKDPTAEHLLFLANGAPAGVFNITHIDREAGTCCWAFYASERAPRGVGAAMEITALDHMSVAWKMRKISCDVLSTNAPVLKLHRRFGFQEEGVFRQQCFREGRWVDVHRLALFTEAWPAHRERIMRLMREGVPGAVE